MSQFENFSFINHKEIPSKLILGKEADDIVDISILMPIYNHYDYLNSAILSCLSQTFTGNYEIIIVDNNHPDFQVKNQRIIELINSERIKYYVNESNVGVVENWNRAIALSRGEYVTFCHDDDELLPHALDQLFCCVKALDNKQAMVVGPYNKIDSEGNLIMKQKVLFKNKYRRLSSYDIFWGNVTNGCGTLYYRELLMSLGGFSQEYYPCMDYALNSLYLLHNGAVVLSEATFNYRVAATNISRTVFDKIAKTDKKIRGSLMKHIRKPSFFLRIVSDSIFMKTMYANSKKWGNKNNLGLKIVLSYYIASIFFLCVSSIRNLNNCRKYKSFR